MARVRGRHARDLNNPPLHKSADALCLNTRTDHFAQWHHALNPFQNGLIAGCKSRMAHAIHPLNELPVKLAWRRRSQLRFHCAFHKLWRIKRNQTHGQNPPWSKRQPALEPLGDKVHFAVTAESTCAHCHGLNHGAIGPHARTLGVNLGPPVAQKRNVGCRSANITDQRFLCPRHPLRANN